METIDRERAARETFESLSLEERRERLVLSPAFRDAYNEIVGAHQQFPVPRYLWDKWLPVLGPLPVALYLKLRQFCFYDPRTGERRDICWPKQSTLAKTLGVNQRQTIARALQLLEEHGFIERKKNSLPLPGPGGRRRRVADTYRIWFEIPLLAEDAVTLLLKQMGCAASESAGGSLLAEPRPASGAPVEGADRTKHLMFENQTYGQEPEGSSHLMFENRTQPAVRKSNSRNVTRTISKTFNVNVGNNPENAHAESEEVRRRESLVGEIGEQLSRMEGQEATTHRSSRFHRSLASTLPETLVRQALAATRDAVEEQRAGRKTLTRGPSAYFAGIAFKLAEREGINLNVKRSRGALAASTSQRGHGPMGPQVPVRRGADASLRGVQANTLEEAPPSDEERARIRQILQGAIESWGKKGEGGAVR